MTTVSSTESTREERRLPRLTMRGKIALGGLAAGLAVGVGAWASHEERATQDRILEELHGDQKTVMVTVDSKDNPDTFLYRSYKKIPSEDMPALKTYLRDVEKKLHPEDTSGELETSDGIPMPVGVAGLELTDANQKNFDDAQKPAGQVDK
jgi:hypothetical protein